VPGNLLDNALKWCRETISLTVRQLPAGIEVLIEDDGRGILERDRNEAMQSGARLDTSKPGTGPGLAIARDLLRDNGASLALEQSCRLGGLAVGLLLAGRAKGCLNTGLQVVTDAKSRPFLFFTPAAEMSDNTPPASPRRKGTAPMLGRTVARKGSGTCRRGPEARPVGRFRPAFRSPCSKSGPRAVRWTDGVRQRPWLRPG